MILFMSGYLLSSQGDRMMMGHSVEGRFPFLDHRMIEFANTIPPKYKIRGLNEKFLLKKAYEDLLPVSVVKRAKQPYRAPISRCFEEKKGSVASSMISREAIEDFGYFDPESVARLLKKLTSLSDGTTSARDDMALVGIASLQLIHHHLIGISRDTMAAC